MPAQRHPISTLEKVTIHRLAGSVWPVGARFNLARHLSATPLTCFHGASTGLWTCESPAVGGAQGVDYMLEFGCGDRLPPSVACSVVLGMKQVYYIRR